MRRGIVLVDLSWGDSCKGSVTDYLARAYDADLIIRYSGGAQCGHRVVLPSGEAHIFSQFGSGTLAGVPTYLAAPVVIKPAAIIREAEHLASIQWPEKTPDSAVQHVLNTLVVHPNCLIATNFAQEWNRRKEGSRGTGRHGSCGQGIGETRSYWLQHGEDALTFGDLAFRSTIGRKLELQRQRYLAEMGEAHIECLDLLSQGVAREARELYEIGQRITAHPNPPHCRTAIFEAAQGILLDEWWGFHPHTTWSTVTPYHAREICEAENFDQIRTIGLCRAMMTRHGAGPLPTETGAYNHLVDPCNPPNLWQKRLRWGHLDLPLLRYAAKAAGPLDGIAVSWLDAIEGERPVCVDYAGIASVQNPTLNLAQDEDRGRRLAVYDPVYETMDEKIMLERVGTIAPIHLESRGPTYLDKNERFPLF